MDVQQNDAVVGEGQRAGLRLLERRDYAESFAYLRSPFDMRRKRRQQPQRLIFGWPSFRRAEYGEAYESFRVSRQAGGAAVKDALGAKNVVVELRSSQLGGRDISIHRDDLTDGHHPAHLCPGATAAVADQIGLRQIGI